MTDLQAKYYEIEKYKLETESKLIEKETENNQLKEYLTKITNVLESTQTDNIHSIFSSRWIHCVTQSFCH